MELASDHFIEVIEVVYQSSYSSQVRDLTVDEVENCVAIRFSIITHWLLERVFIT